MEKDGHKEHTHHSKKAIEWKKGLSLLQKYGWILLLLIVILSSVWYRAYPYHLPITEDWARGNLENYYKNQIASSVNAQYPNLPVPNKQAIVEEQYAKFYAEQADTIETQIKATSSQFKAQMQDDDGQTYLLAIDPWLWYGYTLNYVENGQFGDEVRDGKEWYSLRNGREGQKIKFQPFPFLMVLNYKVMNIFGDVSVLQAAFAIPIILITLAALAAFLIGRKFGGNVAGVVAGVVVGLHSALLNRTAAGFSDTDNLIAFGELVTIALFVLAFTEKETKKRWVYTGLAGLLMAFYAIAHSSWWHIFDFIGGALLVWLVYLVWENRNKLKKGVKGLWKVSDIRKTVETGVGFAGFTWLFGTIFSMGMGNDILRSLKSVLVVPFTAPLGFMQMKAVGITTIWPNVLTTVAELNKVSNATIIGQLGGKFLITLSLLGVLFLILRKENGKRTGIFYGALILFWYIGAFYAAQQSIRFIAFLVPCFALGIAAFAAITYEKLSEWLEKEISINPWITRAFVILMLLVLVISPLAEKAAATAKSEVPSMNDAWHGALTKIHDDADDGIITSWWDFGHWFVTVGQRKVTFDGGDQGERIHWVGRSLLEDNETQSVGILRMLNCAQQKAPHRLSEMLGGGIHNDVKAVDILYSVFSLDKKDAAKVYVDNGLSREEAVEMLGLTHCSDLIPQYYITSQDMVGKSGVWAHFGSWDFHKAAMFNQVKGKPLSEGVSILTEEFGLSQEDADRIYNEIQINDGDTWISPWPRYISGFRQCSEENGTILCPQSIQNQNFELSIDASTMDAVVIGSTKDARPNSIVYVEGNSTVEKKFDGVKTGFSVVLVPSGDSYKSLLLMPELVNSMFTRMFYMEGHGLKHFKKFDDRTSFTGQRILTWKVDWEGDSPTDAFVPEVVLPKPTFTLDSDNVEETGEDEAGAGEDPTENVVLGDEDSVMYDFKKSDAAEEPEAVKEKPAEEDTQVLEVEM